jgi:choline kinase
MPNNHSRNLNIIILVAGRGSRLEEVTRDPKCLLKIQGRTLIDRTLDQISNYEEQINKIILVTGYKYEKVKAQISKHKLYPYCNFIVNSDYELGSIISLNLANYHIADHNIIMDGDVLCESGIFSLIIKTDKDNVFLIDPKSQNTGEEILVGASSSKIIAVERGLTGKFQNYGESIGLMRLNKKSLKKLFQLIEKKISSGSNNIGYEDVLNEFVKLTNIGFTSIEEKKWIEIDFPEDYKKAKELTIN